jgi:hypothetical protein
MRLGEGRKEEGGRRKEGKVKYTVGDDLCCCVSIKIFSGVTRLNSGKSDINQSMYTVHTVILACS